ncbi:hypothetical protein [Pseudoalteromonas aliena]|uniref:Uncharacterized protein n=1 Tax=Pseudoalteromonas aliena SW19 TaxID=1314866 RepID=A0ABR9E4F2_9GAMM|nr:hypothetical protein [Pseudoalteromonas aliena]MBE0361474.1 hypothetical protein [Pseudoalteromonas aliena SW19]
MNSLKQATDLEQGKPLKLGHHSVPKGDTQDKASENAIAVMDDSSAYVVKFVFVEHKDRQHIKPFIFYSNTPFTGSKSEPGLGTKWVALPGVSHEDSKDVATEILRQLKDLTPWQVNYCSIVSSHKKDKCFMSIIYPND